MGSDSNAGWDSRTGCLWATRRGRRVGLRPYEEGGQRRGAGASRGKVDHWEPPEALQPKFKSNEP